MRLTILGGSGGIPAEDGPCSGYLVEHDGLRLLVDPGYGTAAALLRYCRAAQIDAVYVSHGHPDHCADLNPLLRMRVMYDGSETPLPIHCPGGAVSAALALEPGASLDASYELHEFAAGDRFAIGGVTVDTRALPHFVPNAGARFTADGRSLTYTGDSGPADALVTLADTTDVLLAEATYVDGVAERHRDHLNDARGAGRAAAGARAGRLVLTHLWPGTDHEAARRVARDEYDGPVDIARPGLVVEV